MACSNIRHCLLQVGCRHKVIKLLVVIGGVLTQTCRRIIGGDEFAGQENEGQKFHGVENAGLEKDGQKCRAGICSDWKTTDKSARLENEGLENDGHYVRCPMIVQSYQQVTLYRLTVIKARTS